MFYLLYLDCTSGPFYNALLPSEIQKHKVPVKPNLYISNSHIGNVPNCNWEFIESEADKVQRDTLV